MIRYALIFLLLSPLQMLAQDENTYKFVNGTLLTLSGRAATQGAANYHRIQPAALVGLPERLQELARNTAGVNVVFQTNSKSIIVDWGLEQFITKWNLTPLAINGLDLYGWNGHSWQYVSSANPSGASNSATFIHNLDGCMRHYKIYFPLYSSLKNIEIGVDTAAVIKPADPAYTPSKKIVVYGSSITQGASASRPGMAYPAIVARKLHLETYNLGFSGSGKMELGMASILGGMEADLYVLDCVPNPSPEEIRNRTVPFVERLRQLRPDTPILMVESIFREEGHWNAEANVRVTQQNREFATAYRELEKAGYKQLYYIPSTELTGDDHDATIDGTHLTDLGQSKMADRISKAVVEILQLKPEGNN